MDFCDDCDTLLQPKKNDEDKVIAYCPNCQEFKGNSGEVEKISLRDEEREKDPEGGKMLILEDDDNRTVGRPSKEMYCENCESYQEVEYWEIQTRSADESPTRFFRCLNCDKNWREYD